ncbi:GGDEF domain-containing protein [Massilia sp. B-10]|nr:GGDEF domain-containing protein [Massilia sp. B-10]
MLGLLTIVVLLISRVYLKRAYRSVRDMSLSDPLTGLRNRRYLATRIDEDLAQIERQRIAHGRQHGAESLHNADVVFMMIDMDHFKKVNDEHGHAMHDALLKQFSAILLQEVRDSDTVVRWGGEEFLIVAKQSSNAEVHQLAERVRAGSRAAISILATASCCARPARSALPATPSRRRTRHGRAGKTWLRWPTSACTPPRPARRVGRDRAARAGRPHA